MRGLNEEIIAFRCMVSGRVDLRGRFLGIVDGPPDAIIAATGNYRAFSFGPVAAKLALVLKKFLGALVGHWFSILGGAVFSVGLMLWEKSGGPPIPGWVFGVLMGLAVVVAAFFAWTDECQRAEAAENALRDVQGRRPEAALGVLVNGFHLCLDIRNIGAQGTFRAMVETEGGTLRPVPALWETMSNEPLEIGPGLSARLLLATLTEDRSTHVDNEGNEVPHSYGWSLFYSRPPGQMGLSAYAPLEDAIREFFVLRIVVTSNPEMQSGRAIKRVRFVGRDAIDVDSGERHRPRLLIQRDEDEYEDEYGR
jgi:hypothetical protein